MAPKLVHFELEKELLSLCEMKPSVMIQIPVFNPVYFCSYDIGDGRKIVTSRILK